jgi:hypothetical protein
VQAGCARRHNGLESGSRLRDNPQRFSHSHQIRQRSRAQLLHDVVAMNLDGGFSRACGRLQLASTSPRTTILLSLD